MTLINGKIVICEVSFVLIIDIGQSNFSKNKFERFV